MCGGGGGGVMSVVDRIGNAISNIGHAVEGVGSAIDNIIKNPLPVIETIAITAAIIASDGALAPLAEGMIAAPVAGALGSGAVATAVGVGVQQAVIGAAVAALNGADVSHIGTAALQSGVTAGITYGVGANLPSGLTATTDMSAGMAKIASSAIGGAAGAAASAAITGKPIDTAVLTGAVAGGTGAALASYLPTTDIGKQLGDTGVKILGTAGAAGAGAIAAGKNAGYAATMAAINVGLSTTLSSFQTSQQAVQKAVSEDPNLAKAAQAVNDAATTIKNTPEDVANQLKVISDVQGAATRIADAVNSGQGFGGTKSDTPGYQLKPISWDNQDVATLKATGKFTNELSILDNIDKSYHAAYDANIKAGLSDEEAKFWASQPPVNGSVATTGQITTLGTYSLGGFSAKDIKNLQDNLISGAGDYVQTIKAITPDIQNYVDAVTALKTNTATLDAATNNQFSALNDNTQKLIGSVTDYGKYNTQVNMGTLTSTPQQDALNKQLLDKNNVVQADANIINSLDPNSPDYATANQKLQEDGSKLTSLAAQSAALNKYFSGDPTPVNGTDIANAITGIGGSASMANSVSGYYTDTGAIAPTPYALDSSGNVIMSAKDSSGNLTGVYSVGINGSQPPTTDQLQQLASSGNSDAKTFANDASQFLTGQPLSTAAAPAANAKADPAPGTVTTPTTVPGSTPSLAGNIQTNLQNPGAAAAGNALTAAGTVANIISGNAQAAETTPPPPTTDKLPTYASTPVGNLPQDASVVIGGIYPDVPMSQTNTPTAGTGVDTTLNAINAVNQTPNVSGSTPTTTPVQTPNQVTTPSTGTNVAETAGTGAVPKTTDNASTATNIVNAITAINSTPSNTPSTATTGGVSPVPTPTVGGGTSTTATPTTDPTAGGNTANGANTGTVGGNGTGTAGTGTGAGTGSATGAGVGAGIGLGIGLGIGSGSGTTGTKTTTGTAGTANMPKSTKLDTPKATFVKGSQINSNFDNFNIPTVAYQTPAPDPKLLENIQNANTGGIIRHMSEGGDLPMTEARMRGKQAAKANLFGLTGSPLASAPTIFGHAAGGSIPDGHNPQFFSEGGLGSIENRYVTGDGDGTSDSIPAMLANGEFVIPADVVSSLGNGSNDSGAKILDEFLNTIREHKRRADAKHLPPDSKGALGYLLEAKKKVNA